MKTEKIKCEIVCDGGGCARLAAWRLTGLGEPLNLCEECADKMKKALEERHGVRKKG